MGEQLRHFVGEMVSFLEVATCRDRMTAWTPEDLPMEMNTNFRSPVLGLTRIKVYVILPHFLSRNFRVSPTDYIVVGPRDAQLDIPPICPTYPWNGGPKMLKIISLLTCNHLAQLIINPSATTLDFPREDDQPTGPHNSLKTFIVDIRVKMNEKMLTGHLFAFRIFCFDLLDVYRGWIEHSFYCFSKLNMCAILFFKF